MKTSFSFRDRVRGELRKSYRPGYKAYLQFTRNEVADILDDLEELNRIETEQATAKSEGMTLTLAESGE